MPNGKEILKRRDLLQRKHGATFTSLTVSYLYILNVEKFVKTL